MENRKEKNLRRVYICHFEIIKNINSMEKFLNITSFTTVKKVN